MLGLFRSRTAPISKDTLNFLFDSVDAVKLMLEGVATKKSEDPLVVESIAQSFKDVIDTIKKKPAAAQAAPASAISPKKEPAAPKPPATSSPAPPKPVSAKPGAPPSKDDLDLAWEKTFFADEKPIPVEPLKEEPKPHPAVKQAPPAQTAPARPAAPLQPKPAPAAPEKKITPSPATRETQPPPPLRPTVPEPVKAPPPSPAASAPSPATAAAPPADPGTLKDEIEEAKRAGHLERRGLGVGRRAMDAPEVEKQFIRVNVERLDNLMNLVGEMVVNRNRLARQVDLIKTLREELAFSQGRLLHEVKNFEEKYEYTLNYGAPQPSVPVAQDFFELEFDRYDDFNLLSRKLTEISNDTNEIMTELAGFFDSFELDTARISTITTNLQDEITLARMVEVDRLFMLFHRPVRDLAMAESKQVNMVVTGGETKVDKTVFEIISDPLMHMVRNAVSHGIESPEERKKLGKDPSGALILSARHEGNNIVIEVQDDGRGMDPAVLRKTAVDKGFLTGAEAQSLSDIEALNLIFRPGFSTAPTVGKVSGRGVGMDVVSTHLAKINGRIEIRTDKGVGTKFTIRLPLTLAIAQALVVKFKDQEMAIPMTLVEETTRYSFKEIQRAAGEEMVNLRGALVRLLRLNDVLGQEKFPKKDETYRHPTLILGMAEKRLALMVEDILGREEIVVKSLGDFLKPVKLFSGATISGEGNVRLILNVAALFGEEKGLQARASFVTGKEAPAAPEELTRKPRVLVVDDSISIRKYVQRFLDRSGYEVEVAADGMQALDIMGKAKFDAVITDLEMPVMHGYDLMAEMKRNQPLMNVPVIVLTSRAGDKHRQKALEMGAQDYLVKPFEEQEMIAALKRLLSGAAVAGRA
jgi:chemosensory pili system protein ChpA (sensor histidine kinase/response regulator)